MDVHICQLCHQTISPERRAQTPVVCGGCGHVNGPLSDKQIHERQERANLLVIIASAALIVSAFIYTLHWGGYGLEVLALKAKVAVRLESRTDLERMAQICLEVKKADCAEDMYARVALLDKSDYARLGLFQFQRHRYLEATESFRLYFAGGGQDVDAGYAYARALGELGRVQDSIKYFEFTLKSKPDTLQLTVMSNYVKMLVSNNRFQQALALIDRVRVKTQKGPSFMESEYKVIRERLSTARHS